MLKIHLINYIFKCIKIENSSFKCNKFSQYYCSQYLLYFVMIHSAHDAIRFTILILQCDFLFF